MAATTTTRPLAAALLLACSGDPEPIDLPPEPDCSEKLRDVVTSGACEVRLGVGETAFQPLGGGEEVDLIYGPQGGYHVWGAFAFRGEDLAHVHYTDFRLETLGGEQLARTPYCPYLERSPVEEGFSVEWGHTVILRPGLEPADLDGQEVVLKVTVDDLGDANLCAPTEPSCRAAACVRVKLRDAPPE